MKARQVAQVLWSAVSFALLLTALLLAVALLVVPKATDALPLTILTGSMRPAMEPGTLVVVRPTDASALRVGDVVTYQWQPGDPTLVTHRVVEVVSSTDGGTTLVTRGDANDAVDPPVPAERVMGKVVYAVPYFGRVSHFVNSDTGRAGTRWAGCGLIAYGAWSFLSGAGARLRRGGRRPSGPDARVPHPVPQQVLR